MGLTEIALKMIIVVVISFFLLFILVNIMTGCQSWQADNCITPIELLDAFQGL